MVQWPRQSFEHSRLTGLLEAGILAIGQKGNYCEQSSHREDPACFHVYATNEAGTEFELIDGGFTTWTQQVLSNTKERLLISGLGTERLCSQFCTTLTRSD